MKIINKLPIEQNSVMIIFSEVIEYIPLDNVRQFMLNFIKGMNFNKMIITTPQKEFNIHYLLEPNELRHDEHNQEFTKRGFIDFMNNIIDECITNDDKYKIESEYNAIGDNIDGISMSQGMILIKILKWALFIYY